MDLLIFGVLLGLLICEILSVITIILSDKRGIARYVWPRFTLLICQLTTASVICFLLMLYFSGYSESMNDAFISAYEYWSGIDLTIEERKNAYSDLYMYAVGLFIVLFVYAIYNGFEIYVTHKYYQTLPPESFTAVKQTPPSGGFDVPNQQQQYRPPRPPPPPFNPSFKDTPPNYYT
ncbi:unnamed protein product [Anisakis simplex]|uniref:Uncharacterized protein n=1 Tax=Anisakis simplex TaxID=6269 RepID=A0A0M3JX23_ANISI|nr:unnamed protein product [Anisakis simplex]